MSARVLVVGHGMALRALGRPVEGLLEPSLPEWKLASAAPRVYCLDASLRPTSIEPIDDGACWHVVGGGEMPPRDEGDRSGLQQHSQRLHRRRSVR